MKKNLFLIGLLSLATVLVITGCPAEGNTDTGGNADLEGTWQGSGTYSEENKEDVTVLVQYIFNGSDFTMKGKRGDAELTDSYKGTFTSTSTQITITLTHGWNGTTWVTAPEGPKPQTWDYSIDGKTLTLSDPSGEETSQVLTKQ
ncbi:hypothetical protein FACS1894172_20680 [Spirochaetia bacterium]|nr:hypothetical protein FACS1894164_19560 [Spirochaetia bacterium]GHU37311.1 hypothetical protein FACS1894172_20680 [Spirochaetia bacterium]